MRICRKLHCCPVVWGSHWEPCHRVAYGNQPARTHLYDRSLLLCGGWLLTSGMLERTEWLGVSKTVWFDPTVHELPERPATAWTLGWNKLVGSQSRYVEMISLHISRGIALFVGQPAMLTRLPPCCCTLLWITLWNRVWHTHTHNASSTTSND